MTKAIEIYEVGPRDGFQSIKEYIPLETKIDIIGNLVAAGIQNIQLTSFISPKAIPQMQDATAVTEYCLKEFPNVNFFALVPNLRGAKTAWESGIRYVSYVVSLSESHNRANINRTHEESLAELKKIRNEIPDLGICVDLATAFGCPFEGKKSPEEVVSFLEPIINMGVQEINFCDTVGVANPKQVRETIAAVWERYPFLALQIHIHDTRNMGMVNTLAAIESGVTKVQSTLAGMGGCPFAPGASGNLATEDLAYMLLEMGYDTGVDFIKLLASAKELRTLIPNGTFSGHHINIMDGASCIGS